MEGTQCGEPLLCPLGDSESRCWPWVFHALSPLGGPRSSELRERWLASWLVLMSSGKRGGMLPPGLRRMGTTDEQIIGEASWLGQQLCQLLIVFDTLATDLT